MNNASGDLVRETIPNNLDIDLDIISLDAPDTVTAGATFNVSWIVKNLGADTTTTSWYDNLYLSDDEYLDLSDRRLPKYDSHYQSFQDYYYGFYEDFRFNTDIQQINPLQSQEIYTVNEDLDLGVLSEKVIPDNYYLLLNIDVENQSLETNRSNNTLAIPITVTTPNVDLEIANLDAPTMGLLGETINISWEIFNQGTDSQHDPFEDVIYLSDDEHLDESDIQVGRDYHSLSTYIDYGYESYEEKTPLQPGNKISGYESISLTTGINGEEITSGDRYLIIVSDDDNQVDETDENNNILSVPITLIAPEDNHVDLEVASFTVPDTIEINFGEDESTYDYYEPTSVSWMVNNLGTNPTLTFWKDKIYYSQDEILDDADIPLQDIYLCSGLDCIYHSPDSFNTYHQSASVDGGSSYTGSFSHLFLEDLHHVSGVTLGDAYFIVVADEENQLAETNEDNNTFAVPITLTRRNNTTPKLINAIADIKINSGDDFELALPQNTFTDVDEREELRYVAIVSNNSQLPDWLSFDRDTQTFSGTPDNDDAEILDITITASDLSGATVSDSFTLTIESLLEDTADAVVHRFYNSSAGVHFYTADEVEKDHVLNSLDQYSYEGESYASVTQSTGKEVYRFFNSQTGVHLYTTSELERDNIIDTLDNFSYEGVKFYAYETQVEGSVPVYRFYEPTIGVHFYTPNEAEKTHVEDILSNYAYEGIAYYAFPV